MDAGPKALKTASKIALAALGVLLVLAMVLYKERALFADASFILFNIINSHGLAVQEHRYGSFITQMLPYFGQMLHFPIRLMLVIYSTGFNLFYFIAAAILIYRFKQYCMAILMAAYYFLFVSESYFWINNEIHQAIAWMFLFLGATLSKGKKPLNIFTLMLFALLAFLTVFTHFIAIIPLVYLWVYFWIEKKHWPFSGKEALLLSGILIIVIAIKYVLTINHISYDSFHLRGITHLSLKDIINSFTTSVVSMFLYRCVTVYWLGIIVFITGIVSLFINKKISLASWTILSVVGYFIIMGVTYFDQDEHVLLFHIESEWASIGIIVATPFVYSFLPKLKPVIASWSVAIIFTIRLIYIGMTLPPFSLRIHTNEQILAQMRRKGITKLGIIEKRQLQTITKLAWGLPYESVMLSAMEGDKPQLTFFLINPDDKNTLDLVKNSDGFYNSFYATPANELNRDYFSIDSMHPYQIMTYEDLMK